MDTHINDFTLNCSMDCVVSISTCTVHKK